MHVSLTKVGGARVSDVIDIPLCIFEISLAQRNANRHHLVSDGAVSLVPRMGMANPLLVEDMFRRCRRDCRTCQKKGGRDCSGQEVHRRVGR